MIQLLVVRDVNALAAGSIYTKKPVLEFQISDSDFRFQISYFMLWGARAPTKAEQK